MNVLEQTRTPLPDIFTEKDKKREMCSRPRRNLWRDTLRIPHFVSILSGFCATFAFENFFTIFIYTSISQGGLGFPVYITGTITSISTLMYMIASPFLIPCLRKQLGTRRALMLVVGVLPLLALLIPIAQSAATHGRMAVWLVLVIILPLKSFQQMGWPMNDHLNVSCFDRYPELLSTGSAITLIAACSGRAFGPSIAGWLFSIATEFDTRSLGRQISWLSLFVLVLPPVILAGRIPDNLLRECRDQVNRDGYERVPHSPNVVGTVH
ncbi:hypothetical protein I302_108103 [Kwoniella bestiolae CBS 10118]|uniref:Major facilitator superfamily (MFS) profile domain-containing protein n=1 Tax=Kwoniella bestiolae CBS 10118 TaxID=1296100 RepID=A0AAJ8KEW5_9TREE